LLDRLLEVEAVEGRERGPERDAPRTLDLDLLFYGQQVITFANLEIPHPRLAQRAFVLTPLADIAPGFLHPLLAESLSTLASRVCDPAGVRLWGSASQT
jgi:2-amino-4-hydroxy-6-hydroxymethyldihydropteridine diphosphokinase